MEGRRFGVNIIPQTQAATSFGSARPGDGVLTYTAGQRMPDWLLAELEDGGRLVPEAEGVWTLELAH